MLGCIMPMSSPMMKRMLGLPAGACANAGRFDGGGVCAAKATLETSRLPIFRLIFMIPDPPLRIVIGYWAACSGEYAGCCDASSIFAFGHRRGSCVSLSFVIDLMIFRRLPSTRYATSAEIFRSSGFDQRAPQRGRRHFSEDGAIGHGEAPWLQELMGAGNLGDAGW